MTIQEAVRSGRSFTRPCFQGWLSLRKTDRSVNPVYVFEDSGKAKEWESEDLLADDWIIKKPKIGLRRHAIARLAKRLEKDGGEFFILYDSDYDELREHP